MTEALPFKTTMSFAYGEARELAPGVARIVANNPNHFTFKGTNTYLIGTRSLALIDPGPDDEQHLAAILRALGGRPLSHILITHTHHDHVDGLPALIAATGAKTAGYGHKARKPGSKRPSASGGEYVEQDFVPDITLRHQERLAGDGWAVEALFTPGHAPDHLCFSLQGTNILFSGDHVMGWNTSVVAPPEGNMRAYIRSLELLTERPERLYFPGHGGQIEEPQRLVKAYLLHRRMREHAILDCIRQGHNTAEAIVPVVYRGLDPKLLNAASLSVLAHVEHLKERGLVEYAAPLSVDRVLSASSP
jgi:glyoxylase-like metal-dependent hydrolase (beta-lactamase superfamily II)